MASKTGTSKIRGILKYVLHFLRGVRFKKWTSANQDNQRTFTLIFCPSKTVEILLSDQSKDLTI